MDRLHCTWLASEFIDSDYGYSSSRVLSYLISASLGTSESGNTLNFPTQYVLT
jgi:hypothetical protein